MSALTFVLSGCTPRASHTTDPADTAARGGVERSEAGKNGESMLGGDALASFATQGAVDRLRVSEVAVSGQSFSGAKRIEVTQAGEDPWTMQLATRTQTPVEPGDVILASFWIRCERSLEESGEGKTEFVFELARDPWDKSISYPVRVGQEWQEVHVPFVAKTAYAPGEAQMIFRLGYEPQILELAGLRVHNFKKQLSIAELPKTEVSYRGREADAPWRPKADAAIAQHRKAPLKIIVKDSSGTPMKDAVVRVTQKRHLFWFGAAVQAQAVANPQDSDQRYLDELGLNFNSAVIENNLKWKPLAGDWGANWKFEDASRAVDELRAMKMKTRGHVLVWPSWGHLPDELKKLKDKPEELRARVREHVRELVTKMKGKLDHWDVINEPYDNHDLMDILGEKEMVEWFKIAHEADPAAKLYLNDYAILSGGAGETGHRAHFEKTARFLIDSGAPIHGLGLQGHFGAALTAPDDLKNILDRFAKLGLPLIVTEYDINVDDPVLAGDYTRDFYTTLFAHPSVQGIMMWGFWDGRHWKQNAPLYDRDWNLKAQGKAYRKLVFEEWMTKEELRADAQGAVSLDAFLGYYDIEAESPNVADGKLRLTADEKLKTSSTAKVSLALGTGGATIEVALQ